MPLKVRYTGWILSDFHRSKTAARKGYGLARFSKSTPFQLSLLFQTASYYRFLCYSKILEIPFKNGKEKGLWIDQEIPKLKTDFTLFQSKHINTLGGKTLGTWLKKDRDALSHANILGKNAVRDPNNYQDWEDIKWGNKIMHELAEKAIIEKLCVPTRES